MIRSSRSESCASRTGPAEGVRLKPDTTSGSVTCRRFAEADQVREDLIRAVGARGQLPPEVQADVHPVPLAVRGLHQRAELRAFVVRERIRELQDVVGASTADWRFRAILLGLFGAVAVAIAAIGVYGVISYSVACRTQEIGVRLALGALRRDVLTLVLWQGLQTALWGIGVGLAAAYALANVMASMLYGVSATDPATYVATAALLALVAAAACYVPARRAMRIDPMLALRQEA